MNQVTAVIHIIASMAKTVLVQIVCKNATRPVWDSWKLAEKLTEKLDVYAKNGTQMTVHYVRALKIKKLFVTKLYATVKQIIISGNFLFYNCTDDSLLITHIERVTDDSPYFQALVIVV